MSTHNSSKQVDLDRVPPEPEIGLAVCDVVSPEGDICTLENLHKPVVIDSVPWHHVSHGTEKATVFMGGSRR